MGAGMVKALVISDFNADNFSALLTNDAAEPQVESRPAPFGQVYQLLVDENSSYWQDGPDFAVVWTRPQGVIKAFQDVLEYHPVDLDELFAEVDEYARLLKSAAGRVSFMFVPTWVAPYWDRGLGLLNFREGLGIANILSRMNLRLAEQLAEAENIFILDAQRWVAEAGPQASIPKLWYMGKIAFNAPVFRIAVAEVKAGLRALTGRSKKLIVLDLDDTLWGGVVGDDGWENLVLGGHSPTGEAFVDFQKALKALTRRGVILALVSKNTEAVALEAIRSHPEMVIRLDDFAGWRINWQDKAQNIVDLVNELNLGLDSVVFIDDNPVERARVKDMLPEIHVPDWPEDKSLYRQALQRLDVFDSPAFSQEDARRTEMYVKERQRRSLRTEVGDLDAWLEGLGITVKLERLDETNLPRAAQLLNKTNQMNLQTRRMTEAEFLDWSHQDGHEVWTVRVSDKFGDSGLTGILSLEKAADRVTVADYLLSCRVMGRKVEETMVALAVRRARQMGASRIEAEYLPTAKNKPCLEFWQRSGFQVNDSGSSFWWDTGEEYPFPEQVEVQGLEQPQAV